MRHDHRMAMFITYRYALILSSPFSIDGKVSKDAGSSECTILVGSLTDDPQKIADKIPVGRHVLIVVNKV